MLPCCPREAAVYASIHLDSISKILNHVLAIMFVANVLLFFSSWKVVALPHVGMSTVLVSSLLGFQSAAVFLILNSGYRFRSLQSFLAPTDFLLGVALGITIGGTILAFVFSGAYRSVSRCKDTGADPLYEHLCSNRRAALTAVWFWSGLVFWLNGCTALLLAVGRRDLTVSTNQYESVGTEESGNYNYQGETVQGQPQTPPQPRGGNAFPGDMPTPTPSYVGDYAAVPEVRGENQEAGNGGSPLSSSSARTREKESIIASV